MRVTVDEVQARIAAVVDQDQNTANISSTDYALRLKYMNMALHEWGEAFDWQSLYKEYNTQTSTSTGNASILLPTDFRKLASYPIITHSPSNTFAFPETRPQSASRYLNTDRRIEMLGNYGSNYVMRIYGVTLSSGASIKVPYYSSPQSLATSSDIPSIPNADYLVRRSVSLVWEAREDSRFPQAKQDAETILRNLIEYENVFGEASTNDRVLTVDESRYNFRIGRN